MRGEAGFAGLSDRRSRIVHRYDSGMFMPLAEEYYSGSDFWNFGYWEPGIRSPKEASENLMERLLAMIPRKHGTPAVKVPPPGTCCGTTDPST